LAKEKTGGEMKWWVRPKQGLDYGKPEALMQSLNHNSGGPPRGKAQSPQKTSLIGEGWLSLLRWLPPPKLSKVG
jgi:hypothetical protein